MRQVSQWVLLAGSSALVTALWPTTAQAQYVDPGAGSVIVQAVIAVVVGLAAVLKLYWRTISAFVSRRSKRDLDS